MEGHRRVLYGLYRLNAEQVSILVFMEGHRRDHQTVPGPEAHRVSILVFMEGHRRACPSSTASPVDFRFNPCFYGRSS